MTWLQLHANNTDLLNCAMYFLYKHLIALITCFLLGRNLIYNPNLNTMRLANLYYLTSIHA